MQHLGHGFLVAAIQGLRGNDGMYMADHTGCTGQPFSKNPV